MRDRVRGLEGRPIRMLDLRIEPDVVLQGTVCKSGVVAPEAERNLRAEDICGMINEAGFDAQTACRRRFRQFYGRQRRVHCTLDGAPRAAGNSSAGLGSAGRAKRIDALSGAKRRDPPLREAQVVEADHAAASFALAKCSSSFLDTT